MFLYHRIPQADSGWEGGLERSKLFPLPSPVTPAREWVCRSLWAPSWSQSTDLRLCLPGAGVPLCTLWQLLIESSGKVNGSGCGGSAGLGGRDTYYLTLCYTGGFFNPFLRSVSLHFCLFPFSEPHLKRKYMLLFVCYLFLFDWSQFLVATLQHLSLWHASPYLPHVGSSSDKESNPGSLHWSVES